MYMMLCKLPELHTCGECMIHSKQLNHIRNSDMHAFFQIIRATPVHTEAYVYYCQWMEK